MCCLVVDVETTIANTGDPFDEKNRLCYVGCLMGDRSNLFDIEYSDSPYRGELMAVGAYVDEATTLVGANFKFDLHWLKRYGIDFTTKKVHDVLVTHFILTYQQSPYPSLNEVAAYYNLGQKLDVVEEEYWNKGIDTPNVPREVLEEYLQQDLELTYQVYLKQLEDLSTRSLAMQRLVSLHNSDLLVLQEMEFNGLVFDERKCLENAEALATEISDIDVTLSRTCAVDGFNFNSGDHLSCLLYGGTLNFPKKEIIGTYKTGDRKGEPKEGWVDNYITFPKLVDPLKGSALKKEGYYSTDEQTLKSLKGNREARKFLDLILRRSLLDKRRGTYFAGFPKLREEHNWEMGMLHGQLNQVVARTGRLSSSKPNLQNIDSSIKDLFHSRY